MADPPEDILASQMRRSNSLIISGARLALRRWSRADLLSRLPPADRRMVFRADSHEILMIVILHIWESKNI